MGADNSKQKPNAYLRREYKYNKQQQSTANQHDDQLQDTEDTEPHNDENNNLDSDDETVLFGITPGDDIQQLPAPPIPYQQDYGVNDNDTFDDEDVIDDGKEGGITMMGFMDNNLSFDMMFIEGINQSDLDQEVIDDEGDQNTQQEIDINHHGEDSYDTLQKGMVLMGETDANWDIYGEDNNYYSLKVIDNDKKDKHDQNEQSDPGEHEDEEKADEIETDFDHFVDTKDINFIQENDPENEDRSIYASKGAVSMQSKERLNENQVQDDNVHHEIKVEKEQTEEIHTNFVDKKDVNFLEDEKNDVDVNLSLNHKNYGRLVSIRQDEPFRTCSSSKTDEFNQISLPDINGLDKYKNNVVGDKFTDKIKANFEYSAYKEEYSTVKISKQLTNKISGTINEEIPHLYNHMIKSITLQQENEFIIDNEPNPIKIFNYDFHEKITDETLYFVATPCNEHNFQWSMKERSFTANDIEKEFGILNNKLPSLWRLQPQFQAQLHHQEKIKSFVENEINIQKLCTQTKWNKCDKIPIYNKRSNKDRTTLSLTKQEFIKQFNEFITSNEYKNIDLIPIVMPNEDDHHIEFVQIVRLQKTDIFVSYKYDETTNNIKICGIHLDSEFIASQNQLLFPNHKHHSLRNFKSNIDHLTIGNPDLFKNQMNYYKKRCNKLTEFVKTSQEYFLKILANASNMTIDNIQTWIDKACVVCKNSKNMDYLLDLSKLLDVNKAVNVQISPTLQNSALYIQHLQEINNYYFQQTLNPIPETIIPHSMHKQTGPSITHYYGNK